MRFTHQCRFVLAAIAPLLATIQCAAVVTNSIVTNSSTYPPSMTPLNQIPDGQIQAPTMTSNFSATAVNQLPDGQVQAPTVTYTPFVTPVNQIPDGQIQAPYPTNTTGDSSTIGTSPTPVPTTTSLTYTNYTAIGDSYTAGNGNYTLVPSDPNPGCQRTEASYAFQFANMFFDSLSAFNFPACSGANTDQITAQVDSGSLTFSSPEIGFDFGTPDLVSITAGGDNGDAFVSVIAACVVLDIACDAALDYAAGITAGIQPALEALYRDALTQNLLPGQNRAVFVLGYAQFYNTAAGIDVCRDANGGQDFPVPTLGPDGYAAKLNAAVLAMNAKIQAAVQAVGAGVQYVDIDAGFEGHRICDLPDSEVEFQDNFQEYSYVSGYAPFHPTEAGQASMMRDLVGAVQVVG